MTKTGQKIYIYTLAAIVVAVTIYLYVLGQTYYATSLEERFYHPDHKALKPSGSMGHGLGIVGTLLILIGVFGYQARKYMRSLANLGVLKYWLEFHIFLCTLGPIMILFHTSFKFGGIVSISFWSMVAVVASGVLGRFIYLQIPRTIQGKELSLTEIDDKKQEINNTISAYVNGDQLNDILALTEGPTSKSLIMQIINEYSIKSKIRSKLEALGVSKENLHTAVSLIGEEISINRKMARLQTMQKYFKYWHVAHLPFAIIMLIIMVIHVIVTQAYG
jgi:hypothetical protein